MKKFGSIAGVIILAVVILGTIIYRSVGKTEGAPARADQVTITAFVGGEKMAFLQNKEVTDILTKKYGITLQATKSGSMEMVSVATPGKDCLWPSNQVAAELFTKKGAPITAKENIFNSPVVFYAWDTVAEAFIQKGIASKSGESYNLDFTKFSALLLGDKPWSEVGLPQLYGKVRVYTTDPNVSNSGNMFVSLFATIVNGGEVPTVSVVDSLVTKMQPYFKRMGTMEKSSSDLFDNFLKQGAGARPIIVSYENQLIEFALAHPESLQLLKSKNLTLYPQPTVWGEHPLIALTPKGKRLIDALKDPEIQKIAWEQHGFRSGLLGVQNDTKVLQVTGIPQQLNAAVPMPSAEVMDKLVRGLTAN